jgi:N-methylhydantoinase A
VRLPADAELRVVFAALRAAAVADIIADGVAPNDVVVGLEADVRFERQGAEITIPVHEVDQSIVVSGLAEEFRAEYARRFGAGAMAMGVDAEAMTLRAVASERMRDVVALRRPATAHGERESVTRDVQLARDAAPVAVPVLVRASLGDGESFRGPALVDSGDTTVWVSPGHRAHIDHAGSLVVVKET